MVIIIINSINSTNITTLRGSSYREIESGTPGSFDPDIKNITRMDHLMSDALVRVKSILSDVNMSVQSVSSPRKFLPVISDILSELSAVVNCINGMHRLLPASLCCTHQLSHLSLSY